MNPYVVVDMLQQLLDRARDFDEMFFGIQDLQEVLQDLAMAESPRMALRTRHARSGMGAPVQRRAQPKPKRKPSAYNKRLGREIKALTKRYKTKAGKWKKGWSQKRMMKAAHKAAKR
jgi:hypothetical protein